MGIGSDGVEEVCVSAEKVQESLGVEKQARETQALSDPTPLRSVEHMRAGARELILVPFMTGGSCNKGLGETEAFPESTREAR